MNRDPVAVMLCPDPWGARARCVLCSFPSWRCKDASPGATGSSWSQDEDLLGSAFSRKEAEAIREQWRACQYCQYTYGRICWLEKLLCVVKCHVWVVNIADFVR